MKLRDLTELAARNLREAILRNSLTTLGIAVGVASLVAMLSLGVGLQEMASTRLSKTGLFDAIIVMSQANQRAFGGPRRAANPGMPTRRLDEEARRQLTQIKNVVEVYPEVRFPTEIQVDGKPYATTVAGIPNSARADRLSSLVHVGFILHSDIMRPVTCDDQLVVRHEKLKKHSSHLDETGVEFALRDVDYELGVIQLTKVIYARVKVREHRIHMVHPPRADRLRHVGIHSGGRSELYHGTRSVRNAACAAFFPREHCA